MEQRRAKRFAMRLPLVVTRTATECVPRPAYTHNISSVGVLFTSDRQPDPGDPIEYILSLPGGVERGARVRCVGKVIRCEEHPGAGPPYQVAATLERYEFVRSE